MKGQWENCRQWRLEIKQRRRYDFRSLKNLFDSLTIKKTLSHEVAGEMKPVASEENTPGTQRKRL